MEQTTELIPSISIENLLNQRQAMIDRFEHMQALAVELNTLQGALGYTYPPRFLWEYNGHRNELLNYYRDEEGSRVQQRECYIKAIDGLAWKHLMEQSGNLTFMDASAREEWSKSIQDGKFPELTYENISATFRDLHTSRTDMFHRSIVKLFQKLSWDYKTNQPYKFGKRIIVSYVTNRYSTGGCDKMDDLLRAFCVFDGKPEPQYAQRFASLIPYGEKPGYLENDYFHLKWFKNGNGHVTFKRLDIVKQMNLVIAMFFPHALASEVRDAA